MAITRSIKTKIDNYGINLPTDKRTRAYRQVLKKNNWTETQYEGYLKDLTKKYDKKTKTISKQVQSNNERIQIVENVINRNNYINKSSNTIQRFLQKSLSRNKIFKIKPTNSSFKSYQKYTIKNSKPNLFTRYEMIGKYDYTEVFDIGVVKDFIDFHNIQNFMQMKSGSKIWLEGIYLTQYDDEGQKYEAEKNVTTKARKILTQLDTFELLQEFYAKTLALVDEYKSNVKRLLKIHIHIAKVKPLTASSYIDLPSNIKNKKAIINIKNKDNLCFLYSILCALDTPKTHTDRVTNYVNR